MTGDDNFIIRTGQRWRARRAMPSGCKGQREAYWRRAAELLFDVPSGTASKKQVQEGTSRPHRRHRRERAS